MTAKDDLSKRRGSSARTRAIPHDVAFRPARFDAQAEALQFVIPNCEPRYTRSSRIDRALGQLRNAPPAGHLNPPSVITRSSPIRHWAEPRGNGGQDKPLQIMRLWKCSEMAGNLRIPRK